MTETFGPEYVRPAPRECPDCPCCSVALCERGRTTPLSCQACTPQHTREIVADCPCSSETTRGTAAWRAARYGATMHALVNPVAGPVEAVLRAVAAGETPEIASEVIGVLLGRRYMALQDGRPLVTAFGVRYLEARAEERVRTPVMVEAVDIAARTARVLVPGWSLEHRVTVLLDQLLTETQLTLPDLVGVPLEAGVNCRAATADDVVLTRVSLLPVPAAAEAAEPQRGRVDGAPSGGEA
ncbi:hypothetical protein [Streptomyces sp. NPDC057250]|uniref:hypothetical protein n=1 Tax=Streptomyces sp. NPDC057250 TaxID=3346068 RepID=UPI003627634D